MVGMNSEEWKLIIKSTGVIHAGDQLYSNYGQGNVGRLLRDHGFLPVLGTSRQTNRLWQFTERRYAFRELADGGVTMPNEAYPGEDGLSVLLFTLNA
jgi:hypothetical protein